MRRSLAFCCASFLILSTPTFASANYESAQTKVDLKARLALHDQAEKGATSICDSSHNVLKIILAERDGLFKDSTSLASYAYSMGVNVTAVTNAMSDAAMTITTQMRFYTDTECPSPAPIQFSDLVQNLNTEVIAATQLLVSQSTLINQAAQSLKLSNFTGLDIGVQALQSLKGDLDAFASILLAEAQMESKLQEDFAADDTKAAADKAAADKTAADAFASQKVVPAKAVAVKKTTIACVKGKLIKTIVGIKPTCPVGYQKK
jgi:hypothetical protein